MLENNYVVGQYPGRNQFRGPRDDPFNSVDQIDVPIGRRREGFGSRPFKRREFSEDGEFNQRKASQRIKPFHRGTPLNDRSESHRRFLNRRRPSHVPKFSYLPRHHLRVRQTSADAEHKISQKIKQDLEPTWSQEPEKMGTDSQDVKKSSEGSNLLAENTQEKNIPITGSFEKETISDMLNQKNPLLVNIGEQHSQIENKPEISKRSPDGDERPAQLLSANNEPENTKLSHHDNSNWSARKSDSKSWNKAALKFEELDHPHSSNAASLLSPTDLKLSMHQVLAEGLAKRARESGANHHLQQHNVAPDEKHDGGHNILDSKPIGEHSKDHPINSINENSLGLHASATHIQDSSDHNSVIGGSSNNLLTKPKQLKDNNAWLNLRLQMDDSGALNIQLGPSGAGKLKPNKPTDTAPALNEPASILAKESRAPDDVFQMNNHEVHPKFEGPIFTNSDFSRHEAPWMDRERVPPLPNKPIHPNQEPRPHRPPHLQPPPMRHMDAPIHTPGWPDRHPRELERMHEPHREKARLLFDSTADDFHRPPKEKFNIHQKHNTAILESIPFSLGLNIDGFPTKGCPEQKCAKACPGNLMKLSITTGCPTCECCPTVSCKIVCPLGYDADDSGCPTCHCLKI